MIIKNKIDDLKEYEDKIKFLSDIENPIRELIQTIIEKVIIDNRDNLQT